MHTAKYAGVVLCMLVLTLSAQAQQLRLGKQPLTLQKSAILELESDNQGLLFPRITDTNLINGLAPPDGMVIFYQPSHQLMVRANGYWNALTSSAALAATWKTTGNAGTDTLVNFIGTTDDKPLFLKSNSSTYMSMGRRQSLGLTQAYTDYNDNDENVTLLRSALQFDAPGANLYKPKIFVDANGNLRFKGSAAGNDYIEFGAFGTSNAGGFELIVGDEGDEPILFKNYNSTTGLSEMLRVQSGRMSVGGGSFNGTNPEKLLVDAGTTSSYNLIGAKGSINNYLQINIQNKSGGNTASSDVVATANNGNENANFIDMGINSSGFSNTSYPIIGGSNNAYLYSTGNDFVIGNATSSKNLRFFTGGYATANERLRIDGSGNIGIGTTSPAALLHVRTGTSGQSGLRLENLTSSSATTSGSGVLGVDASGNVVRAKAPVYYSGTGATATVDAVTKIWVAEVDNNNTGLVTVAIPSNVGFTTILAITVTAKGGSDATTAPVATIASNTTSQVVIRVVESKTTGILIGGTAEGLEAHVNTSTKLYLRVEGN